MLFTFPSRYLFTIGRQLVFSLTPWSAWIHTKFHVHRVTQEFPLACSGFRLRASHPLWSDFPFASPNLHTITSGSYNPGGKPPVWAVPLSLATTYGIASLSVPQVTEMFHFTWSRALQAILFACRQLGITPVRLPHSEIHGS